MSYDCVMQCMNCWSTWPTGTRSTDGNESKRCSNCGSSDAYPTRLNPTKIVVREDLSMITGDRYPGLFCPRTTMEELHGPQGTVLDWEGLKIRISRGFQPKDYGQYAYLIVDKRVWMTTDAEEDAAMEEAVKDCPENARIFVAGLGLGLTLLKLAKRTRPREVVVAEINLKVIQAVEPILRPWFEKHYPQLN